MDIQILKMSHQLMGSTAEKMGNQDFSEEEYVAALTNLITMDSGTRDFSKLFDAANSCSKSYQKEVSMLGLVKFDNLPRPEKERKERQKKEKNNAPAKAPVNVKQLSDNKQGAGRINSVRSEIQQICRERNVDEIPYFELICHPRNFMKTVDNAFQISFLVRDGFLGLKKIRDEPHIFLYDPDPDAQDRTQPARDHETVQCVMSINPGLWQSKISQFKITHPLLKLEKEQQDRSTSRRDESIEIDESN